MGSFCCRLSPYDFYFVSIRSANYFFTHLPLTYITICFRLLFNKGNWSCFTCRSTNRDFIVLVIGYKYILCHISNPIVIIVNIRHISQVVRVVIAIDIYFIWDPISIIITAVFRIQWEVVFSVNYSVSVSIRVFRICSCKLF